MINEYDIETAGYYSAFRPELHKLILEKCIDSNAIFEKGLDVGCGTGQSAIALTNFCKNVLAIEPSADMLFKSIEHKQVTYHNSTLEMLEFNEKLFDIVTFAGSLFYSKSQRLINKLQQICNKNAKIIIYDFDINLYEIVQKLMILNDLEVSFYQHSVDFSGLDIKNFKLMKQNIETIEFEINTNNLANLLLSVKNQYFAIRRKYKSADFFSHLTADLDKISTNKQLILNTEIFYTVYEFEG